MIEDEEEEVVIKSKAPFIIISHQIAMAGVP